MAESLKSSEIPEKLFAKCEANAQVAERKTYEQALSLLAGVLTFPDHLFGQEPAVDWVPSPGDCDGVNLQQIIQLASRYRNLVTWLKQCSGREQRWLLLALWLKEEGVCEPKDFLPDEVWEKTTAEKRNSFKFSISDLQHFSRVEAWKPYFERLLKDRTRMKKEGRYREGDLERAGYALEAISAARNKRRAIPAVCEWLAGKLDIDVGTLRNAHSRICARQRHKSPTTVL